MSWLRAIAWRVRAPLYLWEDRRWFTRRVLSVSVRGLTALPRAAWPYLASAVNERLVFAAASVVALGVGLQQVSPPLALIFVGVLGLVVTLGPLVLGRTVASSSDQEVDQ